MKSFNKFDSRGNVCVLKLIVHETFRFTFGACVLKNFKKQRWEKYFLILSLIIFTVYVIFAILWNIFYKASVTNIDAIYKAVDDLQKEASDFIDETIN